MQRKNGYIDIAEILGIHLTKTDEYEASCELEDILLSRDDIEIIKNELGLQIVVSYMYEGEKYYFKYSSKVEPMTELFANEVCHCLEIPCVEYDLAVLGPYKGVISKDFKDPEATYITGFDLLKEAHSEEIAKLEWDDEEEKEIRIRQHFFKSHTLEGIWDALEIRYKDRENSKEIVSSLMRSIVQMFILDVILDQHDRHFTNWMIKEYKDGRVELQPIYNNAEIFYDAPEMTKLGLTVETQMPNSTPFNRYIEEALRRFMATSTDEFKSMLLNSLWVLKDVMVEAMCDFIWDKIDEPVDGKTRDLYIARCEHQLELIKETLDITTIPSIKITDLETLLYDTAHQNIYARNIAASILTPSQNIHASLIDQTVEYHQKILDDIKYKIYGDLSEKLEIDKYIIQCSHVLTETMRSAYFDLPYYITPSQYEELSHMIDILLSNGIQAIGTIHNFNPITGRTIENMPIVYKSGRGILEHLKKDTHIIEYDLPFGPEKILTDTEKTKII